MLAQLSIFNFAIIKQLEIDFRSGLNILSGETGAGKSILINALNLILGGRAAADLIRSGCREARVEALFTIPQNEKIEELMSEAGFPFDGEVLIKRSIFRAGRNKVNINGSLATLQWLARLSPLLISISGQHEHQLLLNPENHLFLLDDFAGLTAARLEHARLFNHARSLWEKIAALKGRISETEEKQELNRFQIQEIEQADIQPHEDAALEKERKRLRHARELLEIVTAGYQDLYERPDSTLSVVAQCLKRIERGAELDPQLGEIKTALADAQAGLEDIAFNLRDFQRNITLDPQQLEAVEERLDVLNSLKRKYGPTLSDVGQHYEKLQSMIYGLDEEKRQLGELEQEKEAAQAQVLTRTQELSRQRQAAAGDLEKEIKQELQELHMPQTRFQAALEGSLEATEGSASMAFEKVRPEGIDRAEFMISPNIGEALRPLSRIASGGELSRIMLAMKTILARTGSVETVVFDEVDSGISGATAEVLGEKLLSLAGYHQIICITHLPQIASQGRTHFLVSKEVTGGRTQTLIGELSHQGRIEEIARLLGGKEVTSSALQHAAEMLG